MIPSSKPLQIGDLGSSLLGSFRSSLPLCSTDKRSPSLLGRLTLFAQGSHAAVTAEMSGEGGDRGWLKTHWCLLTQRVSVLSTV